ARMLPTLGVMTAHVDSGRGAPMQPPMRILVATDLADGSQAAVEYAALLGKQLHSDVDVLHVCEPPRAQHVDLPEFVKADFVWDPPLEQPLRTQALAEFAHSAEGHHMKECLSRLEKEAVEAHGRLAFGNPRNPSDAILAVAAEEDYGLIVLT